MPTGYTSEIGEGAGLTFPEFAMRCARAFGALVVMRDDRLDAPIPEEFQPSDYSKKGLAKAMAELERVGVLSAEQAAEECFREYAEELRSYQESEQRRKILRSRYEAMIEQVEAWQPPTPEHQGMKAFMVSQLRESIRFDCGTWDAPVQQEPTEWQKSKIERLSRDVAYHAQRDAEERQRATRRTEWVRALRESLAVPS